MNILIIRVQTTKNTPSEVEIQRTLADTSEVNILVKKVKELAQKGRAAQATQYLLEARKLVDSLDFEDGKQSVYLEGANLMLMEEKPDSAETLLAKALEKYPDSKHAREFYNLLATAYHFQGKNQKAIETYLKAKALTDTTNNARMIAGIEQNMAMSYYDLGNKTDAFRHYLNAISFAQTAHDSVFLATTLNNLGDTYNTEKDFEKASFYLQQAIDISTVIDDKPDLLRATLNLANVRSNQARFDEALKFYRSALHLSRVVRPDRPPTRINYNLGNLYQRMGYLSMAQQYFIRSLKSSRQEGITEGIYYNLTGLGNISEDRGNLSKAIEWYEKAMEESKKMASIPLLSESYNKLYELNKKKGYYKKSLHYLESFQTLRDSLNEQEKKQALAGYEAKLDLHQKEQENALLMTRQEEQEGLLRFQYWLIIAGIVIILVILISLILLYKANRDKQQVNALLELKTSELEQLNNVKDKLFAIVAHDLRNPMGAMQNMLYLLRDESLSSEELRFMSARLEVSMHQNVNIMENLLVWAQEQMSGIQIVLKPLQVQRIVEEILENHSYHAQHKGIGLINAVDDEVEVKADYDLLKLILRNLVSNSIKFSGEGGQVTISAKANQGHILLEVKDTGIGIPPEQQKKIFDTIAGTKSRRGTQNERGSGLGLSLCKEFVEKQQGEISFESEEGKGTAFYISLPATYQMN